MEFKNEAELRNFIAYTKKGVIETDLGSQGRLDVRTRKYDIEVKPFLTVKVMDQGAGQILRYSSKSGGRKSVLAGCTPAKFNSRILSRSKSYPGVEIWFIDQMPEFKKAYPSWKKLPLKKRLHTSKDMYTPNSVHYKTELIKNHNQVLNWIIIIFAAISLITYVMVPKTPLNEPTQELEEIYD